MRLTRARVVEEYEWIRERDAIVDLINAVRDRLGEAFDTQVDRIQTGEYRAEVDSVFADGAVGVNIAAYVILLRQLDVADDYPGFVVDEVLGRELAATIAGQRPLSTLAEATFHVADLDRHEGPGGATRRDDGPAGADDLDAALAAGFQTRMPGWDWRTSDPFGIDPE